MIKGHQKTQKINSDFKKPKAVSCLHDIEAQFSCSIIDRLSSTQACYY